jgi:hypothetical protein
VRPSLSSTTNLWESLEPDPVAILPSFLTDCLADCLADCKPKVRSSELVEELYYDVLS